MSLPAAKHYDSLVDSTSADRIRADCDQVADVVRGFNAHFQTGPDADVDEGVRDFVALLRAKAEELERGL